MSARPRILVAEDNRRHADFLVRALEAEGYAVDHAATGKHALQLAKRNSYDAIVLDWNLPTLEGVDVCRRLRKHKLHVPVLMLTVRDESRDEVRALDAGADDFLSKPYDIHVLLAHLRALVRRGLASRENTLEVGNITIDRIQRSVLVSNTPRPLSNKEFELLLYLAQHAGEVVSREQIMADLWGRDAEPTSNLIDVRVRHLRAKLGEAGIQLRTVVGAGYALMSARSGR